MGLFSEKCSKCGKKISMWKVVYLDNNTFCKACSEKEKYKELLKEMKKEEAELVDAYCTKCHTKYKVPSVDYLTPLITGLVSAVSPIGGVIGYHRLEKCPSCGGKIKRGKLKNYSKNRHIGRKALIFF